MKKSLALLSIGGLTWAAAVGGCSGPDALVGANAGSGEHGAASGGNGVGDNAGGTGGTPSSGGTVAMTGSGGSGASGGSSPGDTSVNYYLTPIRPAGPDVCLPRALPVDASGAASCRIYAAQQPVVHTDSACSCDAPGRAPVEATVRSTIVDFFRTGGQCTDANAIPGLPACDDICLCEAFQAEGADLIACQNELEPPAATNGWCYVSPDDGVGAPALVAECPVRQRHRVIFLGDAQPENEILALACEGSSATEPESAGTPAPVGAPCLPSDESRATFNGYALTEVNIDAPTAACSSGICIVNHFQGRVSCPYGQMLDQANGTPECFVPGSNDLVSVPVDPQRLARPAADTVVCSCRCDGPGDGPFCACPSDMECSPLVQALGFASDAMYAGSYCIPKGTAYDPLALVPPDLCDPQSMNCGDPRPY